MHAHSCLAAVVLLLAFTATQGVIVSNTNTSDSLLSCDDQRQRLATRVVQCFTEGYDNAAVSTDTGASNLLQQCFKTSGQELKVLNALVPSEYRILLSQLLRDFSTSSGLQVQPTFKTAADVYSELQFSSVQNVSASDHNFFVLTSPYLPDLGELGLLTDLQTFRAVDTGPWSASWLDVHPLFRQTLSIYGGAVISVPLTAYVPYMYWRQDVFTALNLTVPATWEEVLQVATILNNTDWDVRVRKKMALCFPKPLISDLGKPGPGAFVLTSILGSLVQYKGRSQGVIYDPLTMQPLVNSSAMFHALDLYAQLAALVPDKQPGGLAFSPDNPVSLSGGYCALGFRWAEVIKATPTSLFLRGNLGVSILPGSAQVWDRVADALLPCTPELCVGSDGVLRPDPNDPTNNVTIYINRFSYGALGGSAAFLHPRSGIGMAEATYQAMAYIGEDMLDRQYYKTNVPFGPMKTSQLNPSDAKAWDSTYNVSDVVAFLTAANTVVNHPNTMLDLRCPRATQIQLLMDDAARLAESGGPIAFPLIMQQLYHQLQDLANNYELGGLAKFQQVYYSAIGFDPSLLPPPPSPPMPPSNDVPTQQSSNPLEDVSLKPTSVIIGAAVGTVGVILLLLLSMVLLVRHGKALHRKLIGKMMGPPGVGPLTTLLVTDVQSSTQLWDVLEQGVMEQSIALSFTILRKVAALHGGHESSTEGDSIILGFHSPLVAIQAALQAQEELLAADWPEQLLAHPLCVPQYAILTGNDEAHSFSSSMPPFPLWDSSPVQASASSQNLGWHNTLLLHSPRARMIQDPATPSKWQRLKKPWFWAKSRLQMTSTPSASSCEKTPSAAFESSSMSDLATRNSVIIEKSITEHTAILPTTVREFLGGFVVPESSPPAALPGRPAPPSVLLFRGLRIRMGLHTGIYEQSCAVSNTRTGRLQYAGKPLAVATSVSSAGAGGMVLLSGDTFTQATKVPNDILLASLGLQLLQDVDTPSLLYAAFSQPLIYRACVLQQLRNTQQLSPGFLDAPYRHVTVCFMHAVGLAALNAWDPEVTQASLTIYQHLAAAELDRFGGYLVNTASSSGMVLAVFKDPAHAIRWALSTIHLCMEAEWDPELLTHEMAEEVVVCNNNMEAEDAEKLASMGGSDGSHRSTADNEPKLLKRVPSDGTAQEFALIAAHRPKDEISMADMAPIYDPKAQPGHADRASLPVEVGMLRESPIRPSVIAASVLSEPFLYTHVPQPHTHEEPERSSRQSQPDIAQSGALSRMPKAPKRNTLIFRGLRLKCAVDVGPVKATIETSTGRMQYFGRIMNRASRISGMTKTGQVWCSQEVWDMSSPSVNSFHLCTLDRVERNPPSAVSERGSETSGTGGRLSDVTASGRCGSLMVAGVDLGLCKLRGIQDSVKLVQCRYEDQSVVHVACKPLLASQTPRPQQHLPLTGNIRRHSLSATRYTVGSRDGTETNVNFARLNSPSAPSFTTRVMFDPVPTMGGHFAVERHSRTTYERHSSMNRIDESACGSPSGGEKVATQSSDGVRVPRLKSAGKDLQLQQQQQQLTERKSWPK